jgi:hypothetical protein
VPDLARVSPTQTPRHAENEASQRLDALRGPWWADGVSGPPGHAAPFVAGPAGADPLECGAAANDEPALWGAAHADDGVPGSAKRDNVHTAALTHDEIEALYRAQQTFGAGEPGYLGSWYALVDEPAKGAFGPRTLSDPHAGTAPGMGAPGRLGSAYALRDEDRGRPASGPSRGERARSASGDPRQGETSMRLETSLENMSLGMYEIRSDLATLADDTSASRVSLAALEKCADSVHRQQTDLAAEVRKLARAVDGLLLQQTALAGRVGEAFKVLDLLAPVLDAVRAALEPPARGAPAAQQRAGAAHAAGPPRGPAGALWAGLGYERSQGHAVLTPTNEWAQQTRAFADQGGGAPGGASVLTGHGYPPNPIDGLVLAADQLASAAYPFDGGYR